MLTQHAYENYWINNINHIISYSRWEGRSDPGGSSPTHCHLHPLLPWEAGGVEVPNGSS